MFFFSFFSINNLFANENSWVPSIPSSCMKWYDWCNECSRNWNEVMCTNAYCESYSEAVCNDTPIINACTEEAKICPDGKSSVVRTWPSCEFQKCPDNKIVDWSNVCTKEYMPVCWQPPMPECPEWFSCTQALPQPKTYSNICNLKNDNANFLFKGTCENWRETYWLSNRSTQKLDLLFNRFLIKLEINHWNQNSKKMLILEETIIQLNNLSISNTRLRSIVKYIVDSFEWVLESY